MTLAGLVFAALALAGALATTADLVLATTLADFAGAFGATFFATVFLVAGFTKGLAADFAAAFAFAGALTEVFDFAAAFLDLEAALAMTFYSP